MIHNQNMKQLSQKTNSFNEKPKPVSPFNEQIHNEMRLFHNTPEKSKRYHGSNHGSNQSVTFDIPEQKLETVSSYSFVIFHLCITLHKKHDVFKVQREKKPQYINHSLNKTKNKVVISLGIYKVLGM